MCYFCLFHHSSSMYTQFDLCNLISVSPPLKQRDGVQQCSVPAQHWPLDVMVVIAVVALALCLWKWCPEKFGGGAVWWPLCPLWVVVAPSGGHFGSAEDLSGPRSSGGRGVASGRCRELNSCLACRSACKSPSNLAHPAPNCLNLSPGQFESFFAKLQSFDGFGWVREWAQLLLPLHSLVELTLPCQLPPSFD